MNDMLVVGYTLIGMSYADSSRTNWKDPVLLKMLIDFELKRQILEEKKGIA